MLGCSLTPSNDIHPAPRASSVTTEQERDLGRFFGDIDGTFVLLDAYADHRILHNPERARTGFLPASTFKIPNALIALEAGHATGPDFLIAWDSTAAPRQGWWPAVWTQDHTLRSALSNSVVWYFQEMARRIGPEQMQANLGRFRYGNSSISGGIDQFWLTGELRISPVEQVDFLRRFYSEELGLSDRTTRIVKDILILEETPTYRLSGKTGWAGLGEESTPQIGWLVGYLEGGGRVYFFATNIDIRRANDAAARLSITRAILHDLRLIKEP